MRARRRIFSCEVCDEVFVDEASLAKHAAGHGNNPPAPANPRAPEASRRWRWPSLVPALLMVLLSTACLADVLYRFSRLELAPRERELHRQASSVIAAVLPGHSFGINFPGEDYALLTIGGSRNQRAAALQAVTALWPSEMLVEALPDTRVLATPRARLLILSGSVLLALASWMALLRACWGWNFGLRPLLVGFTATFLVLQCYLAAAVAVVLLAFGQAWRTRRLWTIQDGPGEAGVVFQSLPEDLAAEVIDRLGFIHCASEKYSQREREVVLARFERYCRQAPAGLDRCQAILETFRRHYFCRKARPKPRKMPGRLLALALFAIGGLICGFVHAVPPVQARVLENDLQAMHTPVRSVHQLGGNWLLVVEPPLRHDLAAVHQLASERVQALGLTPGRVSVVVGATRRFPLAIVLPLVGALAGAMTLLLFRRRKVVLQVELPTAARAVKSPEMGHSSDDITAVELGVGLSGLRQPEGRSSLLNRVAAVGRLLFYDLGFELPGAKLRDNPTLPRNGYRILLRGRPIAAGELHPHSFLAIGPESKLNQLTGIKTFEPAWGLPALWVTPKQRAERLGCMVFDPCSVLMSHLTNVLRTHADEAFTFEAMELLLAREHLTHVSRELFGGGLKKAICFQILRRLLREQIAIHNLRSVLEELLIASTVTQDVDLLTEAARQALVPGLWQSWQRGQYLAWHVPPELESPQGAVYAAELREELWHVAHRVARQIEELGRDKMAVTSPQNRRALAEILPAREGWVVVATHDLPPGGVPEFHA